MRLINGIGKIGDRVELACKLVIRVDMLPDLQILAAPRCLQGHLNHLTVMMLVAVEQGRVVFRQLPDASIPQALADLLVFENPGVRGTFKRFMPGLALLAGAMSR